MIEGDGGLEEFQAIHARVESSDEIIPIPGRNHSMQDRASQPPETYEAGRPVYIKAETGTEHGFEFLSVIASFRADCGEEVFEIALLASSVPESVLGRASFLRMTEKFQDAEVFSNGVGLFAEQFSESFR